MKSKRKLTGTARRVGLAALAGCCLVALVRSGPFPPQTPCFESGASPAGFLPRSEPAAVGIDQAALRSLIREAQASHSHALIVIKDGRVVAERYFGHPRQPLRINSITKSIVSLAVGRLIAEGKISGIKAPLSAWFPQWSKGDKAKVTLWNILTHTSGLQHEQSARNLYQQRDVVKYSLELPVVDEPGKRFSYSNEAVALLAGIVLAAAGKPLDVYLRETLFDPMGIVEVDWDRDAAGDAMAFGGAWMHPRDLARIGQLMLAGGRWDGKQLVPASWVHSCTSRARDDLPNQGLLWWLSGDNDRAADGFGGGGWLGQHLVVLPRARLVAVRLHAVEAGNDDEEDRQYGFPSFHQRVLALVQP